MDDFDGEPSPGGGYDRVIAIPVYDPDGILRRIMIRLRGRGRFGRVAVALEERRAGVDGQVIRFDDAHGHFHVHAPGWPEPGAIAQSLEEVEPRQRAAYARRQIEMRYTEWDAELFGATEP